jgi:high-affinity iron transporter
MGSDAAANASAQVDALVAGIASGDPAAVDTAADQLVVIDRSFRAAPLSEQDQARRAGQLVRYLSLVPIEYGRGVRNGEVVVDIEIGEALAFLDGARASFDDLYLTLEAQDPGNAAEVEDAIAWLEQTVDAAASRTAVADPGDVQSRADGAIAVLEGMFPEEWTRSGGQADFDVISSLLDQMETAVKAGQYDQAESARLEAYAIYELGAEKRLLAFAPGLANETEALFWGGTGDTAGLAVAISRHASAAEIHESRLALDDALRESQERVGAGRPSDGVVIFNAATIVFREGLEAVLILASLVASMIGANQRSRSRSLPGPAWPSSPPRSCSGRRKRSCIHWRDTARNWKPSSRWSRSVSSSWS